MNIRSLLLFAALSLLPNLAFAQDGGDLPDAGRPDADATEEPDAGSSDEPDTSVSEDGSLSGQISACMSACFQALMRSTLQLNQCFQSGTDGEPLVPECAGLNERAGTAIRAGICERARDLVSQCGPAETEGAEPDGEVASAASEEHPRPRRFQLICQNGDTIGSGWRAHCECGEGRVGVDESRYVLPIRRRRERYARDAATVIRVVWCVPEYAVASAREGVRSDIESRVTALQSRMDDHDEIEAARCGVSVEDWHAMSIADRARCGSGAGGDGISEARVREIVRAEVDGLQEQIDAWAENNGAQSRRMDALAERSGRATQELRERLDRMPVGPGAFGFRISALFNAGFRTLHLSNQDSMVPLYFAGEIGVTVSVADRWYLEGAVGFGYALEDSILGDGFQGQYRLGAMHLFDVERFPLGIAFGGIVTERYDAGFDSGTFVSDHTIAGGYLELLINTPPRGVAFYAFARLTAGAGLRFYAPEDHLNFDGGIQFGIGIARFGDDAPSVSEEEHAERSSSDPWSEVNLENL